MGTNAMDHTDFISEDQYLVCWLYSLDVLEATSGLYASPVCAALLRALKRLAESPQKRLRDRSFTIWMGDYGDYFCAGLPGKINADVVKLMTTEMHEVAGYDRIDFLSTPYAPLIPKFRYERGRVIEYSDDTVVGTERLDSEEWYGSGLTILRRVCKPARLIGMEMYQG